MTPRQRIEREALRRRNLARRLVESELRRQGAMPAPRRGSPEHMSAARESRRGWRGPVPPPVKTVLHVLRGGEECR